MSLGEVQRFYQEIRYNFDFFQLFINHLQTVTSDYRDEAIHDFAKEHGFT
ncbi:MAG: hypothetical protein RIR39_1319, partial [Pseudomonadota bacterium]